MKPSADYVEKSLQGLQQLKPTAPSDTQPESSQTTAGQTSEPSGEAKK